LRLDAAAMSNDALIDEYTLANDVQELKQQN
jgi:hypothetical protein